MVKRSRKIQKSQNKPQELVVAAFAEDMEQAKGYEAMLKINDIPVVIDSQSNSQQAKIGRIAIMVPEDFLDEAQAIIESQDAYDDFYDFALEDEPDMDLEDEFLDDNY